MVPYANVPGSVGVIVSAKLATLIKLQTVYGLEDLYNFLEIIAIDSENRQRAMKKLERK